MPLTTLFAFILLLWTIPSYYRRHAQIRPLPQVPPQIFLGSRESSFVCFATEVSLRVPISHSDVGYITTYRSIVRKKKIEDKAFRNGCKHLIWIC